MSVDITDQGYTVVVNDDGVSLTVVTPGPTVPVGGAAGDLLVKNSSTNYDTAWTDSPTVDMLTFDVAAGDEPDAVGELAWDADAGTIDLRMTGNVLQHVGQDVYYRVKADEVIAKGDLVMAVGTVGNSGIILVAKARTSYGMMTDIPSQRLMGLAASSIASGAQGYVVHFGKLRQINTSQFSEGDILYADPATPGGLTATQPAAPNWKTIVGLVVTDSSTVGEIFVRPTFGSSLNNDELVTLTNVTSGQVLTFNGSVWVNGTPTPSTASYVTLSSDGTLTNERVLTAGTGVTITDAGAGSTVTVATSAILPTVVDAKGDLIAGTGADTVGRLANSTTNGQMLTVDTSTLTGLTWSTPASIGAQYVTLASDSSLSAERVLTAGTGISITDAGANSTVTVATSAILPTVVDAKGDLLVGTTNDTVGRLAVGANDTVLMADSGETSGLAWRSPRLAGGAARPLLTGGAYLDGTTGLVTGGLSGNNASAPDSAALSITGDIDIKAKLRMTDWTPAAQANIVSKFDGTGTFTFLFSVLSTGRLIFSFSWDGTNAAFPQSTVSVPFNDGDTGWIRATWDADNGASGNSVKFYTSINGTSWTQLGTTVVTATARTMFDSTAALGLMGRNTGGGFVDGTLGRVIIQSAFDTADNTTSLVFDADFAAQTADALAFTESSSNAATVTINTTRYTYGVPNAQWSTSNATQALTANTVYYQPFLLTSPAIVDGTQFVVTTGPASSANVRTGIYAADSNLQPIGAPILDAGNTTVGTSATGTFFTQVTPVTLQPGMYVTAINTSVAMTVRVVRGGIVGADAGAGTSSIISLMSGTQTQGALPNPGTAWTTRTFSTTGPNHMLFLRWRAA